MARIVGSNPSGTRLSVSCDCLVLSELFLRQADYSSRGVVQRVVCLSVIEERRRGGLGLLQQSSRVSLIKIQWNKCHKLLVFMQISSSKEFFLPFLRGPIHFGRFGAKFELSNMSVGVSSSRIKEIFCTKF